MYSTKITVIIFTYYFELFIGLVPCESTFCHVRCAWTSSAFFLSKYVFLLMRFLISKVYGQVGQYHRDPTPSVSTIKMFEQRGQNSIMKSIYYKSVVACIYIMVTPDYGNFLGTVLGHFLPFGRHGHLPWIFFKVGKIWWCGSIRSCSTFINTLWPWDLSDVVLIFTLLSRLPSRRRKSSKACTRRFNKRKLKLCVIIINTAVLPNINDENYLAWIRTRDRAKNKREGRFCGHSPCH